MTQSTERDFLLRAVGRTRRRAWRVGLGRVLLTGAAALLAAPILSPAVLAWVPAGVGHWAALGLLFLGIVVGVVLAAIEWRRAKPRISPATAARLLSSSQPGSQDLVVTGADLATWGEEGARDRGASVELVEAEIEAAGRIARGLDPRAAVPLRPFNRCLLMAGSAAALLAVWVVLDPGGWTQAWLRLLSGGAPEPVTVGNLVIAYQPPAYTGLAETRIEGSDGHVEGYRGTHVSLSGELSRAVDRGQWEGPGGESIPLDIADRGFSVGWLLDKPGRYRLSFARGDKPVPSDFEPRSIAIREDERPRVEMTVPAGDIEVSSDQEVGVEFTGSDDFRIDRVELVLQGDQEVRLAVPVTPGGRAEGTARFLPLAHPELGAGAHLRVEAWDGDTVGGPKAGTSRSVYVSFLDKRRLAAEVQGLEERLLEALLTHLADHLEVAEPGAEEWERLRSKGRDLLTLLDELVRRVRQGAEEGDLGVLAVLRIEEGLRGALEPVLAGSGARGPLVEELERDILFLDKLLQSLRMEEALSLGDELTALQRSVFDELEAGKAPEELLARVERIQELLAQMLQKLSRGAAEMPDAFANADAVQNMPEGELEEVLRELREALKAGDREAARRLAEKLLETLSRWMAALEQAAQGASQGELDPLLAEVSKLQSEVGDIAAGQEKILQETQAVGRDASGRALERLRGESESFLERQERRLQEVELAARRLEALAPNRGVHGSQPRPEGPPQPGPTPLELYEARRRVDAAAAEVRRALREDLSQARQGAGGLEQAVQDLRNRVGEQLGAENPAQEPAERYLETARQRIGDILDDIEGLARRRLDALTPEEEGALGELAQRQGQLSERTRSVGERLGELAQRSPLIDPSLGGNAEAAREAMGQSGQRLGGRDPYGSMPPQSRALEELAELSRRLQGAQGQMLQGMQGQGMQIARSRSGRQGGRDVDRSPVEIPKEKEARELRAFRQEVLRAMQAGRYPKDYEEEVERYYERLIR